MTFIKKTNFTVINIIPLDGYFGPLPFSLEPWFSLNLVNPREIGLRVKAF